MNCKRCGKLLDGNDVGGLCWFCWIEKQRDESEDDMNLRDFDGHSVISIHKGWVELWETGKKVWFTYPTHLSIADAIGSASDYCLRCYGYLPDIRFE